MNRDELVRLATLWFVVMTFLQTGSASHPVLTVVVFIALILLFMIPVYVVVDFVR